MYISRMADTLKLQSLPCYCATLRQAARAVTALYEEALAESGLRSTQFTALELLKSAPRLTTTDVASGMGMDQTTATRTLALLKKGGLVIDAAGSDRRERRWALTAAGEATLRRVRPKWEAAQAILEQRLGRSDAAALKKAAFSAASRLTAD
jgi:DNA-binding MarR family transcriptional regulator